jgi:hypothetical protein
MMVPDVSFLVSFHHSPSLHPRVARDMVHSTKLHTVDNTETPGNAFSEKLRADLSTRLSCVLEQAGAGPLVLWGEWAMLYYGIPVAANVCRDSHRSGQSSDSCAHPELTPGSAYPRPG